MRPRRVHPIKRAGYLFTWTINHSNEVRQYPNMDRGLANVHHMSSIIKRVLLIHT